MFHRLLLTALCLSQAPLSQASRRERCATLWLEPYANLTSVSDYQAAWAGLAAASSGRCYVAAGSTYALKHNGTLGYADTAAGEGLDGVLFERFGFPALRSLNITATALVYVTHTDGIAAMLANPQPFIDALLEKAATHGLVGFDIDYEPQGDDRPLLSEGRKVGGGTDFMSFLSSLAQQMAARGLTRLTIDVGGCPSFFAFDCARASGIAGLTFANTMDSFNVNGVAGMQKLVSSDGAQLGAKWAPGFEPNNLGEATFRDVMAWLASPAACATPTSCPIGIASWQVRESNTGPQPEWLWDAVNTFLDAP